MKPACCPRLWQVEAARDGRLSDADLHSFELHANRCKACSEERGALDHLAHALRASGALFDDVALRRGRKRILGAALRSTHAAHSRRKLTMLLAVTVASVVLGAVAFRNRARHRAHLVDVVASHGAHWERHASDAVEELQLSDGVFALSVHRRAGDPRVVFIVPDGIINDMGTEFEVTVADRETRAVVVRQGAVMLTLAGRAPLLLQAASSWAPSPPLPKASAAAPSESLAQASEVEAAQLHSAPSKRRPAARRDTTATQANVPLSEDVAYLRIIALRREGRSDEAGVAAAEYLHSFPEGFRRTEVLGFLRSLR